MVLRYIGDTHLYYSESVEWRHISLDDYANKLVTNWECVVRDEDETRIVGDIGDCCPRTIECIKCLRGRKVLILGNHDTEWKSSLLYELFDDVVPTLMEGNILVTHIPPSEPVKDRFVIHGHHHQYVTADMLIQRNKYLGDRMRFNCASDLIGDKPCTLQQLRINKEQLRASVLNL